MLDIVTLPPNNLLIIFQDISDAQYRSFRNNLPILSVLVIVFHALKKLYLLALQRISRPQQNDRLHLVPFLLTFSLIMLTALHGTSILKILVILTLNYAIAKFCRGSKLGPILSWVFNGGILFANEWYEGYRFGHIHPALHSWVRGYF